MEYDILFKYQHELIQKAYEYELNSMKIENESFQMIGKLNN